ncbi:MAG: hypothetical protein HZB65_01055 [Candidatus Aenigmarchaeota archaeon]|nr:hypothetical protein [Candidatus Aenigmarchaeota archaeon]
MSKLRSFANFIKFFFNDIREDWHTMDRKILRIAAGIAGFVIAALFWLYFFQSSSPFGF